MLSCYFGPFYGVFLCLVISNMKTCVIINLLSPKIDPGANTKFRGLAVGTTKNINRIYFSQKVAQTYFFRQHVGMVGRYHTTPTVCVELVPLNTCVVH